MGNFVEGIKSVVKGFVDDRFKDAQKFKNSFGDKNLNASKDSFEIVNRGAAFTSDRVVVSSTLSMRQSGNAEYKLSKNEIAALKKMLKDNKVPIALRRGVINAINKGISTTSYANLLVLIKTDESGVLPTKSVILGTSTIKKLNKQNKLPRFTGVLQIPTTKGVYVGSEMLKGMNEALKK
jgi:hypothetical protein